MSKPSIGLISGGQPYIAIQNWFRNAQQYARKREELSNLSFKVRQKSNESRDVTTIDRSLSQQLTSELLIERIKEITEWRDVIDECVRNMKTEREQLLKEKNVCEKQMFNLHSRFTIINECNTLRCSRKKEDMCLDAVDREIQEECRLLQQIKNELTDICCEAYNCASKLLEVSGSLAIDIDLKNGAITVEKEALHLLDENPSLVGRKPDTNRFINYVSHESWLENCKYLQSRAISELERSKTLRDEMIQTRQKAYCRMLTQFDKTNFALRKRLFEVRYVLDELTWQKQMLEQEREQIMNEIAKTKERIIAEINALKLFESQNSHRIYRIDNELCQDKCTDNLETQILNARHRVERLENELNSTKKTYHLLDQQIEAVKKEIETKNVAIVLDERCLRLRAESDAVLNSSPTV